jgi:putative radical SAM enzyme (TIGR03279 family)
MWKGKMAQKGLKITEVESCSPGERIGLVPGDRILSVNGHDVPDELALKFYLAEEHIRLAVRKISGAEKIYKVDLSGSSSLGIKNEDFRTRTCNNSCLFCFVDQLPPGVRASLRVKDDDYRLSFLHGNYITLTNLAKKELDRIIEHRLTPLYISVHATAPELRARMLGRKKTNNLEYKMKKLIAGGIRLHAQIVLMPGINDGRHLRKTVTDLYRHFPGVESVAIVPLGLSDHGRPRDHNIAVSPSFCRKVVRQVSPWQDDFRKKTGTTFAYLADEFYLQGGMPLPRPEYYDGFAQIEDGVGMVRKFLNDFDAELRRRRKQLRRRRGTLITAKLFYPYLASCIRRLNHKFGSRLQVCAAENQSMGKSITVAGLLSGGDIVAALQGVSPGSFVIIPNEVLSQKDQILLDDLTVNQLSSRLGVPVYTSGRTMRNFFDLLCARLRKPLRRRRGQAAG